MSHDELNAAAEGGNIALLQELLHRLDEAEVVQWLKEAIVRASYDNRETAVKTLLKVGSEPLMTDDLGNTTLHWAGRRGHDAIARVLIDHMADQRQTLLSRTNQDKATALHLASESNAGAVVQLLLKAAANPAAGMSDKKTPLHLAADRGHAVAAAVLLEAFSKPGSSGADPRLELCTNDRSETPLARAAARGHGAVIKLLLQQGASKTHRNLWGHTVLQLAAQGGHVGAVAVLLENQADVHATASDGSTPLHTAVERGNAQVVEHLLNHSADVHARAERGRMPIHAAAERGSTQALEVLLMNGAQVDSLTHEDRTPLSYAAARGHAAVVKVLLAKEAELQAPDLMRQMPLHAAAANGRIEVAELLINKKAQVEPQDSAGRTPVRLALDGRQDLMVRLLLRRGAQLPEQEMNTPGMDALRRQVAQEVLEEQLLEAEGGSAKKELKAVEKQFDEARYNLERLSMTTAQAHCAPAIHDAECRLNKLLKDNGVYKATEKQLRDEIKSTTDLTAQKSAEVKKIEEEREALNVKMKEHEASKIELNASLSKVQAEIAKVDSTLQSLAKKEAALPPIAPYDERLEELRAQLAAVIADGQAAEKELEKVHDQLEQWHKEKEQAALLAKKAHELLYRDKTEPASTPRLT